MTTIATDGRSMAGDGLAVDHCGTIVDHSRPKVHRLNDGRIAGAAGSSFDADSWVKWLNGGKQGDCPIEDDRFTGLILSADYVLWVDHKGREIPTPWPIAIGSGQDVALGAMEAGATPSEAVTIACRRDPHSGGSIHVEHLQTDLREVA